MKTWRYQWTGDPWIEAERRMKRERLKNGGVEGGLQWLSSVDRDMTPAERREVARLEALFGKCVWKP